MNLHAHAPALSSIVLHGSRTSRRNNHKSSVLKTKVRRKDRANLQTAEYYDNYFTPLLATRLT